MNTDNKNNNPFEPDQNPEHQDWWPDPNVSMASTPEPEPAPELKTEPEPETPAPEQAEPEAETPPQTEPQPAAPDPSQTEPQPAAPDPSQPLPGETYADYLHRLDRERRAADAKAAAEAAQAERGREEYWVGPGDHGRGRNDDPNYGPVPEEYAANGMSKAAFAFGIMSLVSIIFNSSFFFGALGIMFALLSRKNKFSRQAKAGLIMSAAGLTTFAVTMAVTIFMLVSSGAWGTMMNMIDHMDPNNPFAVSEIQQAVMDELLGRNGVQNGAQSTTSAGDSAAESSAAVTSDAVEAETETEAEAKTEAEADPVPAVPAEANTVIGSATPM